MRCVTSAVELVSVIFNFSMGTGAWDDIVMDLMLNYLLHGNTHIRADLLNTIIFSKNVQYFDKVCGSRTMQEKKKYMYRHLIINI